MALNSNDEVVQRALQALTQQRDNMDQARRTVQMLHDEVQGAFMSGAADVFISRMQDWLDRQALVKAKFDEIYDNFGGAHRGISHGHQEAFSVGSGSFGGSGGSVYSGLH